MVRPFPFCVSKCHRHVWNCHSEKQSVLCLLPWSHVHHWSYDGRLDRSVLIPPGLLLWNVTVLDVCPLKPSEVVVLQVELHTDPGPLFLGCLHGAQQEKGSAERKEPQQKDTVSDICKINGLTVRVGVFQGHHVGTVSTPTPTGQGSRHELVYSSVTEHKSWRWSFQNWCSYEGYSDWYETVNTPGILWSSDLKVLSNMLKAAKVGPYRQIKNSAVLCGRQERATQLYYKKCSGEMKKSLSDKT